MPSATAARQHGLRVARSRRLAETAAQDFGVRTFWGIQCARCKTGLHDEHGNPRWEIQGRMEFVCAGGCRD